MQQPPDLIRRINGEGGRIPSDRNVRRGLESAPEKIFPVMTRVSTNKARTAHACTIRAWDAREAGLTPILRCRLILRQIRERFLRHFLQQL